PSRGGAAGALRAASVLLDKNLHGRAPARADRLAATPRASGACRDGQEARSRERLRRGRCQLASCQSRTRRCSKRSGSNKTRCAHALPPAHTCEAWRSLAGTFHLEGGIFGCLLGSTPVLARDDIRGVPTRPVVIRSARFVLAMALLCLSQKLGQSRDVYAEPSSGKPRLDLLEQPAVAVWITERGERAVACAIGRAR